MSSSSMLLHADHRSDEPEPPRSMASFARRPPVVLNSPTNLTHTYLPDPASFPEPILGHHLVSNPGLSDSSSLSASTRSSSGYTTHDYTNVHVASSDDENMNGSAITTDAVVKLLARDASRATHSRIPTDNSRSSESYSVRSRSSSVGNSHDSFPRLHEKPSYDVGWAVDEAVSEEETDDDPPNDDFDNEDQEEERTAAIVIAEEGRGLIVQGEGVPLHQLQVQPGTTHLLIGSSSTPNVMHSYLTATIPQICTSLLALDISANYLGALPPTLALCRNLEELNIASNPLRVLPVFLADLTNLRVLIADSTGVNTLPDTLADLDKLHTISIRRNKMHSLPSWLCLLPVLQSLYVDGNPFQGPWKALVEPLLAKIPATPVYPLSTPMFPLSTPADTETDVTDTEDLSDPPSASPSGHFSTPPDEEDHTITADRGLFLTRGVTSPLPEPSPSSRPLTRTLTAPNRRHPDRPPSTAVGQSQPQSARTFDESGYTGDREVRKMKSAGDLRRGKPATLPASPSEASSSRPPLTHYPTSLSSSNLLNMEAPPPDRPTTKRFASVGPAASMPGLPHNRPALTRSLWGESTDSAQSISAPTSVDRQRRLPSDDLGDGTATVRPKNTKESKEKGSRWGFLKKMSMGKMRMESPSIFSNPQGASSPMPRPLPSNSVPPDRLSKTPQINMRISTTGSLDAMNLPTVSAITSQPVVSPVVSPPDDNPTPSVKPSVGALNVPATRTNNLLALPSPTPQSAKRRSFLPIESPFQLSIPEPSSFIPGVTATNDDDSDARGRTPSPAFDHEQYLRKEEERAREAYSRALRSVMAYLKDMNDLGLTQQVNCSPAYGSTEDGVRSRRPTVVESSREGSTSTPTLSSVDSGQLRSLDSIQGLRSGPPTQTMSVLTTDSNGSSEERKFKDDKGKRAMVVREIVLTEKTYVKGLQELVEIYIKPGSAPVNLLSGSSKETVIPAAERKIVFGGIDALFSFHHDNFLPALEAAVSPLMNPSPDVDTDGLLSLTVAKNVGNIFLKHAAFMKMYSTYINNFDNSIQRVKAWTSSRTVNGNMSPGGALSPSSSTVQLAGLGLSMSAISAPGIAPDAGPSTSGLPILSTSQRKRIRSFLKRCRINPRHSQLNLEGYLLLPVQRIPRYRLLLEELLRSTPPPPDYMDDPLERALAEISLLANNMNEGKREAESRRKLVQWQTRIRGKFPSPLVQPHRRLIMDGPLLLTRVVRKAMVSFEAINGQGDSSTVQVDCLAPELTPRPLMGILCNDLLVLCRDPSEGQDPSSPVDLWAVLRMQTLPQPASIVHGNALRLVDNKAILYFDAPSPSDALNWYRAINLHIPASKT